MRYIRTFWPVVVLIFVVTACTKEDVVEEPHELIGTWRTEYSSDAPSYSYDEIGFLTEDNAGWYGSATSYSDGKWLGFNTAMQWNVTTNPKRLIIEALNLDSEYFINSEGQLIIKNYKKGAAFNRVE